ncbi:DUF5709 domain-containing protein [Cellulomonas xylanilytica]|uniref:DUF5709 domain-containing protein n=1 Tax=Cellulomonas xylanilytica TaxID=233583 RepID=A0A510V3Q5_9CELL|nr:DUF5709 domain-containing protein [Cellulomonas xylanilytica]GEK21504.1 hypothetical protein CXY01_20240 [Cellulomonas xylanilytica]
MTDETPATRTDPALGSEGDTNQLPGEDTLAEPTDDTMLEEGYSPPDHPRPNHFGETAWEQAHGETLTQRLEEEEPEVWEDVAPADPNVAPDGAGQLVEDDDAVAADGTDAFAIETGSTAGTVSAEEGAIHVVDEEDVVLDQLELADDGDETLEDEDPRDDQDVLVDDLDADADGTTDRDVVGDLGLTDDPVGTDAPYLADDES